MYRGGRPLKPPEASYCIPQDFSHPKYKCRKVIWKRRKHCCLYKRPERLKTLCQHCHERYIHAHGHYGLPMPPPCSIGQSKPCKPKRNKSQRRNRGYQDTQEDCSPPRSQIRSAGTGPDERQQRPARIITTNIHISRTPSPNSGNPSAQNSTIGVRLPMPQDQQHKNETPVHYGDSKPFNQQKKKEPVVAVRYEQEQEPNKKQKQKQFQQHEHTHQKGGKDPCSQECSPWPACPQVVCQPWPYCPIPCYYDPCAGQEQTQSKSYKNEKEYEPDCDDDGDENDQEFSDSDSDVKESKSKCFDIWYLF